MLPPSRDGGRIARQTGFSLQKLSLAPTETGSASQRASRALQQKPKFANKEITAKKRDPFGDRKQISACNDSGISSHTRDHMVKVSDSPKQCKYCPFSKYCNFSQLNIRNYSEKMSQWSDPRELRIPVSYGHIAAKVWGDEHAEPVLALHGWQDNAGTFDKLIPLLVPHLKIVAIDAPGHGLSSHKPPGTFYHFMEMLIDIKRVVNYLKWDTFSFLGHSMGGTLALMYSSVYPEAVKNIILLDIIKPASRSPERLPQVTRTGIESLMNVEEKMSRSPPVYSLEEACTRLMNGMVNEITSEAADVLLKRGCIPSSCGKGVVFSRDIRVKATEELQKLSHDDLKAFMKRIKCNMLILLGNRSFIYKSRTPEVLDDFLNIYEENCNFFKVIKVEGNHFVHLNNPEVIAPHINEFFKKNWNYHLSSKL